MGCFYWGKANHSARKPTDRPGGRAEAAGQPWPPRRPRITDYLPVRPIPRLSAAADGHGWRRDGWRRAPIQRVALAELHATQDWISHDGLRHHSRPGARPHNEDMPWVTHRRGRLYLLDGHHQAVNAIHRGASHITARVRRTAG